MCGEQDVPADLLEHVAAARAAALARPRDPAPLGLDREQARRVLASLMDDVETVRARMVAAGNPDPDTVEFQGHRFTLAGLGVQRASLRRFPGVAPALDLDLTRFTPEAIAADTEEDRIAAEVRLLGAKLHRLGVGMVTASQCDHGFGASVTLPGGRVGVKVQVHGQESRLHALRALVADVERAARKAKAKRKGRR